MNEMNPVDRELNRTGTAGTGGGTSPDYGPGNLSLVDAEVEMDRSERLSVKQQQALEWLMSGGTIKEAAELVGVKRQTVSRWVNHHPDFCSLYEDWQEQVRTGAEGRVLGLADAAIDNLVAAVQEKRDVKASQFVLKLLGIAGRKRKKGWGRC